MLMLFTFMVDTASADVYKSFASLKAHEKIGTDYKVVQRFSDSKTIVLAIHGGTIEKETDDIAYAVAKKGVFDFYGFIGLNSSPLHLTSTHFNDPTALKMVAKSNKTLSIHGFRNTSNAVTLVGGQDKVLAAKVSSKLKAAGFDISTAKGELGGYSDYNICNKNCIGKGVQLELSTKLRNQLACDEQKFDDYVNALVKALE